MSIQIICDVCGARGIQQKEMVEIDPPAAKGLYQEAEKQGWLCLDEAYMGDYCPLCHDGSTILYDRLDAMGKDEQTLPVYEKLAGVPFVVKGDTSLWAIVNSPQTMPIYRTALFPMLRELGAAWAPKPQCVSDLYSYYEQTVNPKLLGTDSFYDVRQIGYKRADALIDLVKTAQRNDRVHLELQRIGAVMADVLTP